MLVEEWWIFHFVQVAIAQISQHLHKIIVIMHSHKKGDLHMIFFVFVGGLVFCTSRLWNINAQDFMRKGNLRYNFDLLGNSKFPQARPKIVKCIRIRVSFLSVGVLNLEVRWLARHDNKVLIFRCANHPKFLFQSLGLLGYISFATTKCGL